MPPKHGRPLDELSDLSGFQAEKCPFQLFLSGEVGWSFCPHPHFSRGFLPFRQHGKRQPSWFTSNQEDWFNLLIKIFNKESKLGTGVKGSI